MQILIGGGLAGIAMTLRGPIDFRYCLAFMWLIAFSSATHDIAADGFYMLGLDEKKQAYFIGIRNTFYRLAIIFGQGILVMIAGWLEKRYSCRLPEEIAIPQAWSITFYLLAALFFFLFLYHDLFLPRLVRDTSNLNPQQISISKVIREFLNTFLSFFQKQHIVKALVFILFYRLAEAQLVKISSPFLLDNAENGGLGLSTSSVGFVYGTIGIIALTIGGIIGGVVIARQGLKSSLWGMAIALNLPNAVYLYLAFCLPENFIVISGCIALEQLGYGYGFTSLAYFMMLFSQRKHQTAHYAICTGFMALGMMIPGMVSGWIEESTNYRYFFMWVMLCTLPSFWATGMIRKTLHQ